MLPIAIQHRAFATWLHASHFSMRPMKSVVEKTMRVLGGQVVVKKVRRLTFCCICCCNADSCAGSPPNCAYASTACRNAVTQSETCNQQTKKMNLLF